MANSFITDRKKRYSFALLTLASLSYCGYYLYSNPAQNRNPISKATPQKNDQATNFLQQGNSLYKEGKYTQAIAQYHEAIKLEPTNEQAHINTSLAAAKLNDVEHAIEHAEKALVINPNYVAGYVMLGNYQEAKGQFAQAKASYEKALSLNANLYEAHIFMSRLLAREGTPEVTAQAIVHAKKAITVQPQSKDSLMTLADAHFMAGNFADARELYQQTIQKYPQAHDAHLNLGKTYEHELAMEKALPYYQKSVAIKPDYANGHVAIAGAHFMMGNLKEGFKEYEWRWYVSNMPKLDKKWDGGNVQGKRVIVLSENGLGDIIQYVRFAKMLKDKGAYVIVHTTPALTPLFKLCDYIDQVITAGQEVPAYDTVTSMQSIPFHMAVDRTSLPTQPYLKADQKLVDSWKQRLAKDTNFKIGICWAPGDDSHLATYQKRGLSLADFKPLTDMKNVSFYSLQKGQAAAKAPFKLISFGDDFDTTNGAFMDTAALMKQMDLIISVDTSVAHLAGALGVPTWILLPFVPDVRWMGKTTNSIWYPSVQLFRQSAVGDWQAPIAALKQKLQGLVK